MRQLLASAAVLSLLAGVSASAQDENLFQRHDRGGPQRSIAPRSEPRQFERQTMPEKDRGRQWNGRGSWSAQFTPGGDEHHERHRGSEPGQTQGPFTNPEASAPPNGWRGDRARAPVPGGHPNVDIRAYHKNVWSPQHFHAGTYRPPSGWYPHRWRYGEYLPRTFFIRNYWIVDFWDFALFPPPPGLVWVRVGDDALLVDEYTGEIVEVVYGVFY